MDCPRCRVEMKELKVAELTPHLCPKCEGSWLSLEQLAVLKEMPLEELEDSELQPTLVADSPEIDLEEHLECPVCQEPLVRYRDPARPDLIVDRCPDHGVWLDDGELAQMMQPIEVLQKKGLLAFLRGLF